MIAVDVAVRHYRLLRFSYAAHGYSRTIFQSILWNNVLDVEVIAKSVPVLAIAMEENENGKRRLL